jgi:hypothetical protein
MSQITMGILIFQRLNDLKTPDFNYFIKMHRNKNGRKIEIFWKTWKKKSQISTLFLNQRTPDDWPDALDHLAIGLIANK